MERWVGLFSAGDAGGFAALYHDDAVNYQLAETPTNGRPAIRETDEPEGVATDLASQVLHGLRRAGLIGSG